MLTLLTVRNVVGGVLVGGLAVLPYCLEGWHVFVAIGAWLGVFLTWPFEDPEKSA